MERYSEIEISGVRLREEERDRESRIVHGWVGLGLGCFLTQFNLLKLINFQPN